MAPGGPGAPRSNGRSFVVREDSAAPPERVWELLVDHRRYKEWTPLLRSELEVEGSPDVNGLGAVRALGTSFFAARERVLSFEPPRAMSYELVSGMPVKGYVAEVELIPSATGGTHITWTGHFDSAPPGLAGVLNTVLRRAVTMLARGIATTAAKP